MAAACDGLVALPRLGQVESLNVSAAATALLFEAVRQRSLSSCDSCRCNAICKTRNLGLTELRAHVN